ncbi:helix-turn-helix domain-containing protein [Pseudonocardia sp. KRD-184]|uniref:Helix-turn-helix domain-containing protein n=1 Tax=Pseudonocardia oceani TaxID=2792013 RepID=A0ABS6U828_9PSEU|nr:helix-turn-helix domain-containing protein [Pseudonocardia oceani]MBW0088688.1 helix-turn-helix domain-containing protein [Pseudonocardia oceani]MBW0095565.1 helix-turn-helix domain-containing protein [Pseudonocardia oceani]MBW0108197.1 helix-turn-helix domain-containing protein [Pseudonocardia oceani]MBW0120666.1 helix-turn-helix domain-containing protein [Pseudonocardia oceani]MBW0128400.1 helix-turn-helix domain-containing protein [Pseudonocardia oceani]
MADRGPRRPTGGGPDDSWLADVARDACRDVGGVPVELLGDYLPLLADAAASGRRPDAHELDSVGLLGRRAAELGVSAGSAVQLYLSAARRLWQQLPAVVRSRDSEVVRTAAAAVLHVVDEAVARLVDGYTDARRQMVRWEETLRREFIDDLLRGDADVAGLAERAVPFGLDMGRHHQIALAAPSGRSEEAGAAISALERAVVQWAGDRDVLVATKDGWIVAMTPADTDVPGPRTGPATLGDLLLAELGRLPRGEPWRVAVGRPYPGSYGIARSYEEAREGLTMAVRLHLDSPLIRAEQLLVYRVLLRDQPAIADLVQSVLGQLVRARGGAGPLLATLDAYFAAGAVTTETARRLHLSVRAVTYRLDRITTLTGYDPTDPAHRFTVHTAVLGAKLLGWPQRDLPVDR